MSDQFETKYTTTLIREIVKYPAYYVLNYYDDLKWRIDLHYETIRADIKKKNESNDLSDETIQEWKSTIKIINICQEQCLDNRLPNDLIEKINNNVANNETLDDYEIFNLMAKIQSHLFANNSSLAILIKNSSAYRGWNFKILILEDTLKRSNIENLLKSIYTTSEGDNFVEMRLIEDKIKETKDEIVFIEKFNKHLEIKITALNSILNNDCFKNFRNIVSLNISNLCSMSIENGCFQDLNNLKRLIITHHDKDYSLHLNSKVFLGISNLQLFYLISLTDIKIENGCFMHVKKLKELKLDFKLDIIIDQYLFNGLESLENLTINKNPKMLLKRQCFKSLKCLKRLKFVVDFNLEFNDEISQDIFSSIRDLSNLKHLDLSNCCIKSLKRNNFFGLDNLECLELEKNLNIFLEEDCFNGLNNLKFLNLSGCQIKALCYKNLIGLIRLKVLDLSHNHITANCFQHLSMLQKLNISGCQIDDLIESYFFGLTNLESLVFTGNSIAKFAGKWYKHLKNLKHIKLSRFHASKLEIDLSNEEDTNDIIKRDFNFENSIKLTSLIITESKMNFKDFLID